MADARAEGGGGQGKDGGGGEYRRVVTDGRVIGNAFGRRETEGKREEGGRPNNRNKVRIRR